MISLERWQWLRSFPVSREISTELLAWSLSTVRPFSHTQPVTHSGEALLTLRQSTVNLPRCSHFRNHYLRLIRFSKTGSSWSICILGYWNNTTSLWFLKFVALERTHWDLMAASTAWSDHVSILLLTYLVILLATPRTMATTLTLTLFEKKRRK